MLSLAQSWSPVMPLASISPSKSSDAAQGSTTTTGHSQVSGALSRDPRTRPDALLDSNKAVQSTRHCPHTR